MKPLQPPDSFYLEAAHGWLWFGDHRSALAELERINPIMRTHPSVLEARAQIYSSAGKWHALANIAAMLVKFSPGRSSGWIDRSSALNELDRTQEAFDALLPAAKQFPNDPIVPYDLARYSARLERPTDAKRWLQRAIEIEGAKEIALMAREDPYLQPLCARSGEI